MAKVDEVRYTDLAQFLEGLGYACRKLDDTHVIWEHPQVEAALLIFNTYRPDDRVWSAHVLGTKGTLVHHGLLNPDDFERWRLNLYVGNDALANGQGNSAGKGRKRAGNARVKGD